MTSSTETLRKSEPPTWSDVVSRLRQAFGVRSEAAVARELGFASNAWANRKKASALPWDRIIEAALARGVSVDWILTGREASSERASGESVTLDEELLADVLVAVEVELGRRHITLAPERRAKVVMWLYREYQRGARHDDQAFRAFMDLLA